MLFGNEYYRKLNMCIIKYNGYMLFIWWFVFNFFLDFIINLWKIKNKYIVMEDYSIVRLEEELGMYGYLYNFL